MVAKFGGHGYGMAILFVVIGAILGGILGQLLTGVEALSGAHITAPDLRGGAAVVLAALAADGVSTIDDIRLIERGYEDFDMKIRQLGGIIEKVTDTKAVRKFRMRSRAV